MVGRSVVAHTHFEVGCMPYEVFVEEVNERFAKL